MGLNTGAANSKLPCIQSEERRSQSVQVVSRVWTCGLLLECLGNYGIFNLIGHPIMELFYFPAQAAAINGSCGATVDMAIGWSGLRESDVRMPWMSLESSLSW